MKDNPSKQLLYYYRNRHQILRKKKLQRFLKYMETKVVKYDDLMSLYNEIKNEINSPKKQSLKEER